MKVTVDRDILFPVLDTLLERRRRNAYPYNKPDAVIPQNVIPKELRDDKWALACFYFYICIYMRGGIESLQAFNAMLRMRDDHRHLFDPYLARWHKPEEIQEVLKEYVGWDSKAASINWHVNSWRLTEHWKGNPLLLVKGLRTYKEALRRIRNKLTKGDVQEAGADGVGFRGFQPKMVSMLVYFYDWEHLLEERFLYPAPADFHNFRLGLNQGAIIVTHGEDKRLAATEVISRPWREALMAYLRLRKADPIEVADAIWLWSLVNCGNSPLNSTRVTNGSGMFTEQALPHDTGLTHYLNPKFRKALNETCLRCPLLPNCKYSIPSKPYYTKGKLILRPRPKIEDFLPTINPDLAIPNATARSSEAPLSFLDPND
jgi:hypothetical protein